MSAIIAVFVAQLLDPFRIASMVAATLLAAGFWPRRALLWIAIAAMSILVATAFGAVLGSTMGVVLIVIVTNMVIAAIVVGIRRLWPRRAASRGSPPV